MQTWRKETRWVLCALCLYLLVNLVLLTRYPLMHSDESWLGGLTRNMMAHASPAVTEPFFDLKPRYPHAIKILFHLLQMPLIGLFGYGVFSLRLLSLLGSCAALWLVYRCSRVSVGMGLSMGMMALFALCAPFLTAAHTARQEILLLAMMFWLMHVLLQSGGDIQPRTVLRLGCITGLSVGLHPNSFLLAVGCGLTLLCGMLLRREVRLLLLLQYIAVTAAIAAVFVGLSFLFDVQFPAHYHRYGQSEFDLDVPLGDKLSGLAEYLAKLWHGVSGTYILPDLKGPLLLTAGFSLLGTVSLIRTRDFRVCVPLCMTLGALAGTVFIGRYNQLSAVLWLLPGLMLLPPFLHSGRLARAVLPVMAAVFAAASIQAVSQALPYDYRAYCDQIATFVAPDTKTLANLNTAFYFDNDALLDLRNLAYLQENGLTFAQYVESRGIETILWPEEMQLIYDRRPYLNALYGNPRAVPEVQAFLQTQCTLLGSFENPGYAVRMAQEIGKSYHVAVYRVNRPAMPEGTP